MVSNHFEKENYICFSSKGQVKKTAVINNMPIELIAMTNNRAIKFIDIKGF